MGVPLPSALALLILIGCAGSPAELLFPPDDRDGASLTSTRRFAQQLEQAGARRHDGEEEFAAAALWAFGGAGNSR